MKWYGSLDNRIDENKMYCDEIKVGTYVTKYGYTDRDVYEVVDVVNQEHVFVREMNAKRIDNNGMSDAQTYEYSSVQDGHIYELKLTKYGWKQVNEYGQAYIDMFDNKQYGWWFVDMKLLERVRKAVAQGKTVKRMGLKWNISFGVADKYFDFSF